MTIGSLFSGIGGLELGLEWAGLGPTIWQVEQDPFCRSILERHWPNAARFDDVRTVGSSNLDPVDIVCGGFPCQDLSYAGKGAGLEGERSGLYWEMHRVIRELRPRVAVLENVAALLTRGLDVILGSLAEIGYDAEWHCIRASDVGAPHRRERIFVLAYPVHLVRQFEGIGGSIRGAAREGQGQWDQRKWHGHAAWDCGENVADADESRRDERSGARDLSGRIAESSNSAGGGQPEPSVGRAADGFSGRLDRWPARPNEAQHEWEAPRTAKGVPNRSARLRALGNAVVPQVAYQVGLRVRELL